MALIINYNGAAHTAMNNVSKNQRNLSQSFSRISSGLRITSAADDAAGLAISENMDAEVRSLRQAHRNTNDGISVIQTAEGASGEVADMLKRMRELAVQSSSDTLGSTERGYVHEEFVSLSDEINRVANVTEFNGIALTNGSAGVSPMSVQVGIDAVAANSQIDITLGDLRATALGVHHAGISAGSALSLSTTGGAQSAITQIDAALVTVNGYRSKYGATQNRLESALNNNETYTENLAASSSRIRDADFAHETAELSKYQIMQQAGISVLGQANGLNSGALRLIG